jgi:hypothetical protein
MALKGTEMLNGFLVYSVPNKILKKILHFFSIDPLFTEIGQDLAHLAP